MLIPENVSFFLNNKIIKSMIISLAHVKFIVKFSSRIGKSREITQMCHHHHHHHHHFVLFPGSEGNRTLTTQMCSDYFWLMLKLGYSNNIGNRSGGDHCAVGG